MHLNNSILLISNDDFIIGLIKGYSTANNIGFSQLSSDKVLQPTDFNDSIRLIIIDTRKLNITLLKSNLKLLCEINDELGIPVCAIPTGKDDKLMLTESWIDDFFHEPIIDGLHHYFQTQFSKESAEDMERRNKERRTRWDRRNGLPKPATNACPLFDLPGKKQLTPPKQIKNTYKLGPFTIDNNCKSVSLNNNNLELTCKEFNLFKLLATDTEHVFSADEIIQHLWPKTYKADKSDLYQYMHLLRKKIEDDPDNPLWIVTIKGVGYKLNINDEYTMPLTSLASMTKALS